MPLRYDPGMDGHHHTNRLRSISGSILTANHGIPGKENETNGSSIGALLLDLATE